VFGESDARPGWGMISATWNTTGMKSTDSFN
jgi:hypothetical protein